MDVILNLKKTMEEDKKPKIKSDNESIYRKESLIIISELAFVLLPFLVIIIIQISQSEFSELIYTSNWSLAATILFGQTVVKLILGIASYEAEMEWKKMGLIGALIIVLGLIPSAIILTLFTLNANQNLAIVIIQFFLFVLSGITFLAFGTIGQALASNSFSRKIAKMLN